MKKALLKHVALMAGAALSAGTCFVSCIDDEPVPNRIEIFTEQFSNSRKMTVVHQQVHWVDGDRIYISGTEAELSVSDGHVYANDVAATSPIRALFPTGLTTSAPTSDEVQITLPAEYHYRKTGNLQKLDMPMAAYATGTDAVQFKHLTGALCLMITNSDNSQPLTIDRITITSDRYQLSGSRLVNFQSLTTNNNTVETSTVADRSVSLMFDLEPVVLPTNSTDTTFVVVPIPAVGGSNRFTVEVSTYDNPIGSHYVYRRQQTQGGALDRNQLGYIPVTMKTVSDTADYIKRKPLFTGGGSETYPYLINSLSDFLLFVRAVDTNINTNTFNKRNRCFALTHDIDCEGLVLANPINFKGIFDGRGHNLSNLGVKGRNTNGNYYCSLFDDIKEVKNLTINNLTLKLDNGNYTNLYGGCFQSKVDTIIIRNCHINNLAVNTNGEVTTTYTFFGNFVGHATNATIDSCTFSGFINDSIPIGSSSICYGGIIGQIYKFSEFNNQNKDKHNTITNCTVSYDKPITIVGSSSTYVGGIIGRNLLHSQFITYLAFSNCSVSMNHNVKNNTVFAGGIAGSTANYSRITLDNVTVSGTINATHNGTKFLAGLIGKYYNNNNNSRINGDNTCSYGALSIYENNNQMTDVFPYNN